MMENAIDEYLAMRRAAGFELEVPAYLLRSFARFATGRGETHVWTQSLIEWASEAPSLSPSDDLLARLKDPFLWGVDQSQNTATTGVPPVNSP